MWGVCLKLTRAVPSHLPIFVIVQILLIFCLFPRAVAETYIDVGVSEAKAMIDSNIFLVVLDVRNESEYCSGHIRNSRLIPFNELESRLDELGMNYEILVYAESGGRSRSASQILAENGFLHVYNMVGGITSWIDAGYPVYVKYSSIKKAINEASEGDAILVSSGIYNERVVVNKRISLIGEDAKTTTIYGDGMQAVIAIVNRHVNVTGFTIKNGTEGIYLQTSANCSAIEDCIITKNDVGIFVKSDNNLLAKNTIFNNTGSAIEIYASCSCATVKDNIVTGNTLLHNAYGVNLVNSEGSLIYHNNFINNSQSSTTSPLVNMWDNGYPSGGNYWSNYNGTDFFNGPDQNETGSDGIGDISHNAYFSLAVDSFPLMAPITVLDDTTWHGALLSIDVVSNSTVSNFQLDKQERTISFNVTDGTDSSFCRITVPNLIIQDFWQGNYTVLIDGESVDSRNWTDPDNTYIYFTYHHSEHKVTIVPEFTSILFLLVFMSILLSLVYLGRILNQKRAL